MLEFARTRARRLKRALWRTAKRSPMLRRVYLRLAAKRRQLYLSSGELRTKLTGTAAGDRGNSVNPANMIWIFGSGRSGSTWLRSVMGEMSTHRVWEEPMVGKLFGEFYAKAEAPNLRRPDFVMGDATRKGWIRSIRNFVLDGARYAHPRLGGEEYLVIKEPNGSAGAPLLMEALPESRMILLIRDPRDVVASVLDAARKGGWLYERVNEYSAKERALADNKPDTFVKRRTDTYLQGVGNARRAYESHRGPKVLIKYEELRADTLNTMKRIYSALGIAVDEDELARAVKRHSWESIPKEERGKGKFYRKAAPGGWREDLTPKQVKIVEKMTAPVLEEFYPG